MTKTQLIEIFSGKGLDFGSDFVYDLGNGDVTVWDQGVMIIVQL